MKNKRKPNITDKMLARWQKIVDLMATVVGIPAGLIMKIHPSEIEVLVSSATKGNPYKKGEKANLNTGLYCETVMTQRAQLLVPDARKDPEWAQNPDIELSMVSYLGLPLAWPDGKIFGTICVLDNKENRYSDIHQELLRQFSETVEIDLGLLVNINELKQAEKELRLHREHLESLVGERTAELKKANEQLQQEITQRMQVEESLRASEKSLAEAQRIANMGNWDLDLVKNELRWSDEIYRIFGLKPQEFGATYEAFLDAIHPDDREFVDTSYANSVKNNTPYDIVHRIARADGEVRYVHEKAEDIKDEKGKTIRSIGTVQDITEQKQAEDQIKASLKEKEVLLQEVHHRVKNNMQIISSLFNLQSGRIKDKQAFEIFKSSQNRVRSMALIHERFYQSEDMARVDFAEYAQNLSSHLFSSHGISPGAVKLNLKIKDVFLDINTAIPCGLIINELVSNSLKHAFPGDKKGEIKIAIHPLNKNGMEVIVSDNGVGFPKKVDFRKTDSLGLHLVRLLTEDQLHGDIKLDRTKGTSFHIRFRKKR